METGENNSVYKGLGTYSPVSREPLPFFAPAATLIKGGARLKKQKVAFHCRQHDNFHLGEMACLTISVKQNCSGRHEEKRVVNICETLGNFHYSFYIVYYFYFFSFEQFL